MQPVPPPPTGPAKPPAAPLSRHAEASDARLAIREHEEQARQKKEDEQKLDLTLPADVFDQAELSVSAVIDFLVRFLHDQEALAKKAAQETVPQEESVRPVVPSGSDFSPVTETPSQSPQAWRAAAAYGHAAEARTARPAALPSAAANLISPKETRQIHTVLERLRMLQARGVLSLRLARAETFLDSLENAAMKKAAEYSGMI